MDRERTERDKQTARNKYGREYHGQDRDGKGEKKQEGTQQGSIGDNESHRRNYGSSIRGRSNTPGLAPSSQPLLHDGPSITGPSAGTGIVATLRIFFFSLIFPCRSLLCHSLVIKQGLDRCGGRRKRLVRLSTLALCLVFSISNRSLR